MREILNQQEELTTLAFMYKHRKNIVNTRILPISYLVDELGEFQVTNNSYKFVYKNRKQTGGSKTGGYIKKEVSYQFTGRFKQI